MRITNISCRFLLAAVICGSLASCSLFRPKESEEDTWGDPHWEIDGSGGSQASSGSHSESGFNKGAEKSRASQFASVSQKEDYWPTTQELEDRGGSLTMEDYERKADDALRSLGQPPGSEPSNAVEDTFSLAEPELPSPMNDGGDPLAGFWEEDSEDLSDDLIQRAGNQQSESFVAENKPETTEAEEGEAPPVFMPIPPSSSPGRTKPQISSAAQIEESSSAAPRGAVDSGKKSPDVVLLTADPSVSSDSAFSEVSLLNNESVSAASESEDSFLDSRRRLSLSEITGGNEGPLSTPSIAAEDTVENQ